MEIPVLISIPTWIPWKKLNSIKNFTIPKFKARLSKNEKKK